MPWYSISINDAVAEASPVLRRMRLDGLDRATLPFAERYVLAWLGGPRSNMELETVVESVKVWPGTAVLARDLGSSLPSSSYFPVCYILSVLRPNDDFQCNTTKQG